MLKKILIVLLSLVCTSSFALVEIDREIELYLKTLERQKYLALPIGIKIWFNECNGQEAGLTCWNEGENFASLGIGHFLWYPATKKLSNSSHSFPRLLKYLQMKGIEIPSWLKRCFDYCPWQSREIFYAQFQSAEMVELRTFLSRTIIWQAEFLMDNFIEVVPHLLMVTPTSDRYFILNSLKALSSNAVGLYAMIDFLNFKGAGLHDYYNGTGLLQVLRDMRQAPSADPLIAFAWSAKRALVTRTLHNKSSDYENWLRGWLRRINSYYLPS